MVGEVKQLIPNSVHRDEMLGILDEVRQKVEANEMQTLIVVEIPFGLEPTLLHRAGVLNYAETIGRLFMSSVDLFNDAKDGADDD